MEPGRPVVVSAANDKLSPPHRVSDKFDGGSGGEGRGGRAGGDGEEGGAGRGGAGGGGGDASNAEIENVDVSVGAAAVTSSGSSAAPVLPAVERRPGGENVGPVSPFVGGGGGGGGRKPATLEALPRDEIGEGKGDEDGRREDQGKEGEGDGGRAEREEGGGGQEVKEEGGEVEKGEGKEEKGEGQEKKATERAAAVATTAVQAAAAGDGMVGGDGGEAAALPPPAFVVPRLGEGVVADRGGSGSRRSGRRGLRRVKTLGKAGGSRLVPSHGVYDGQVSGGEEVR